MNQIRHFVARVQAIALTGRSRFDQKREVEGLLKSFTVSLREAHSGEPNAINQIGSEMQRLQTLLSDVRRHASDRHAALIDYARTIVAEKNESH